MKKLRRKVNELKTFVLIESRKNALPFLIFLSNFCPVACHAKLLLYDKFCAAPLRLCLLECLFQYIIKFLHFLLYIRFPKRLNGSCDTFELNANTYHYLRNYPLIKVLLLLFRPLKMG